MRSIVVIAAAAVAEADQRQKRQTEDGYQRPLDNAAATAPAAASIFVTAGRLGHGWGSGLYGRYRFRLLLLTEYVAQHYSVHSGLDCHRASFLVLDDHSGRFLDQHHGSAVVANHHCTLDLLGNSHLTARTRTS